METTRFPRLSLITGGAASGKSLFAETLVMNSNQPRAYIATAQAWDDEMRAKIAAHKTQRGADWRLVEAPITLPKAISTANSDEIILVDCLTMWLSNLLLENADLSAATTQLCTALDNSDATIVCVTNEVGLGIVPDNALARQFRDAQGKLNQIIAKKADLVVAVMSGLPLPLKGKIPDV